MSAFKPYKSELKVKVEVKFKNYNLFFKLKQSENYQCYLFENLIIMYKIKKVKVL